MTPTDPPQAHRSQSLMTGGMSLVETLASGGIERVYCVPGESYLAALDAFYEHRAIDVVTCRHESGAGFMAVAEAKLGAAPGVAFASRGPGATNATIALHMAREDAVPLILFIGDASRDRAGRGAFQAVDYVETYADLAKDVLYVHEAEHVARMTARAWQLATSDTPGPVVVVLPEDMLGDPVETDGVIPSRAVPPTPGVSQIQEAIDQLSRAHRPLLIAGAQIHDRSGRAALAEAADRWDLPVLGAFKQQDLIANTHRCWAGQVGFVMNPELGEAVAQADLVLAVGTRLGDITTQGYRFPRAPLPQQPLIHVYPDARQLGRNIQPALGIVADSTLFLEALTEAGPQATDDARSRWVERVTAVNRRLRRFEAGPPAAAGADLGGVVHAIDRHASDDCIFTIDSGNFATWVHRYLGLRRDQRLLASASGAMGGGVPSGVAAALRHPDRMVVVFVGDGGALMTGNELATAQLYQANLNIIVADNHLYGTIRTHQEKAFPGRQIATDLASPDFAAWGEAFGATGYTIGDDDEIETTIARALQTLGSSIVHVRQSRERLTVFG